MAGSRAGREERERERRREGGRERACEELENEFRF